MKDVFQRPAVGKTIEVIAWIIVAAIYGVFILLMSAFFVWGLEEQFSRSVQI